MSTDNYKRMPRRASGPTEWWAWIVSTFFGAGFGKPGPGTWGSAAAVLCWAGFGYRFSAHVLLALLIGIALVVFAFNLALPISQLSSSIARSTLGIALACVLLSFMMMIVRSKAIPQVIGFLAMENGLFFAATAATNGMPMIVELGIGLDVLVGALILGVFMFQIREQFDSLDTDRLAGGHEETGR